jgi:hypothetical protein
VIGEQEPARQVGAVDLRAALVVVLVELLEDELALELEVGEARAGEQLAEELQSAIDQGRDQGDLEQRVIAAGLGVERAAQRLEGEVDVVRGRVPLGPAEQHVLDEVAESVVLRSLEPGPHLHVQDQACGVEVRQVDRHHAQAVRQARGLGANLGEHRHDVRELAREVKPAAR